MIPKPSRKGLKALLKIGSDLYSIFAKYGNSVIVKAHNPVILGQRPFAVTIKLKPEPDVFEPINTRYIPFNKARVIFVVIQL
jgi:hypothetical protein